MIEKALELAIEKGADFVDVRVFKGRETRIYVENGTTKTGGAIKYDINLRVCAKGNWGACSGNDPALLPAMAENAVSMAKIHGDNPFSLLEYPFSREKIRINAKYRPDHIDIDEKLEYIQHLEKKMEKENIKRTSISYTDTTGTKSIHNSEGASIEEEVMTTCFTVSATAKKGGRIESASARKYVAGGYEYAEEAEDLPLEAVRRALELLTAKEMSQGRYTAIFDPLLTGTFIHEILGHCVEADLILQGNSVLENKLGHTLTQEDITIWDDPTIPLAPVCYKYDDEGIAARKKPIIMNGELVTYLHSLDSASRMRDAQPGNARSEDYSFSPLIRMSNTYVAGSESRLEGEVGNNLFLRGTLGGEVEPGSGKFFIRPVIGEIRENGKTTYYKNLIVIGTILDTLKSIEGVGNDFYLDSGVCEKEGQTVLIGSGGASLNVSNVMVVGG
ncbi:MAG: TldD/PmbA family protein [Theionarchaea archaeon]|nr:TldD/PmbA family protein [Theionarchaea archaeon]